MAGSGNDRLFRLASFSRGGLVSFSRGVPKQPSLQDRAVATSWEGKSTAPEEWSSDAAFYSHRGGIAIWEYEQCLLDVMEATSHQSGAPEPAITMLAYVRPYQKAMFNNRTFAALSLMSFFFATTTLLNSIPPSLADLPIPLFFMGLGVVCLRTYWRKSPRPEKPFNIP